MPATSTAPAPPSLGPLVRRHDPDRYLCALFAPPAQRETLFTLYAFNHELARACEVTREPGLALIRLQWWREVVEGEARAHEVAAPLHAAVEAGRLAAEDLLAMIEARETEAEAEFATLEAWRGWLLQGAGSVAVASARALGAPPGCLPLMRALGAGFGVAGQLRNVAVLARAGRCLLPLDVLADHGLSAEDVLAGQTRSLPALRGHLADTGLAMLGAPQPCDRQWLAAGLPAVLARADLRAPGRPDQPHGFASKIRVLGSALASRC